MRAPTAAFWAVVLCTIAACAFTEEPDPGHGQYCQQVQAQRRLQGNPVVPDLGRDAGITNNGEVEEAGPIDGGDRDGGGRDGRMDGQVDGGDATVEDDAGDGGLDAGDAGADGGDAAPAPDMGPDVGAADASPPRYDAGAFQDAGPAPPDSPDGGVRPPPPPGGDAGAPPPIGEPC